MFNKLKKMIGVFHPAVWNMGIIILFVTLIFIALGRSLNFALFGDDWFMFYVIDKTYGPGKTFPFLALEGYSQPWGVMNLCLMIIRNFFGYESYGYFLVSMFLRVLASLSGYVFLFKFIKSKLIALTGSLFILIGYAGIESSNYVLHMNVYLVTLFLFLSLTFLIDSYKSISHRKGKVWKLIFGCFLFAVSLAVNPIRSHGLLPFFLVFDLIFSLTIAKIGFGKTLLRSFLIALSAFLVYKLGFFGAVTPSFIKFDLIKMMIAQGNFTFLSAFVTNLGKIFLPDLYTVNLENVIIIFGANWYKWVVLAGFLCEFFVFALLSNFMKEKLKNLLVVSSTLLFGFVFIFFTLKDFPRDIGLFLILVNSFLGIFFISFLLWALFVLFISKLEIKSQSWLGMIAGTVIILTSFAVPLLFNPGAIMGSDNRYYTVGLSGVAISIASLLKLITDKNKKLAFVFFGISIILLIFNIKSDRKYMGSLYPVRNLAVTESMWNKIFEYVPKETYPDKLLLFYFDDKENSGLAHNTILFGFPPRMAIEYKIKEQIKIPAFTNIYEEVVSVVTDGKAFLRLGYPQEKIAIDQVVAFKFTKNGELLDITREVRRDLNTRIKNP